MSFVPVSKLTFASACCAALLFGGQARPAHAGWAEDALKTEADYIVNCSVTTYAHNAPQIQSTDPGYGAFKNVRMNNDTIWVRPGENAMAVIGLMAAATKLKSAGYSVTTYNAVIDAFFINWVRGSKAAYDNNASSNNYGGFNSELFYNADGTFNRLSGNSNAGVTGAMLSAMWKYYEYNVNTGRTSNASSWLSSSAYDMAVQGGKFLKKCHNTNYNMLYSAPGSGGKLWINDTALAVAGLRCLNQWAQTRGLTVTVDASGTTPTAFANTLVTGLESMKDNGGWKGFFKTRDPATGTRSYEGSLDQLCFVPYETNALDPTQDFAASVSDFWTNGADGRRMTYQTSDSTAWTYYGTRWHLYDDASNPENDRLTPGAGLQLAKVEWKYGQARGNATVRDRAMKRYQFANSATYANLWFGTDGRTEAGVGGGICDWRVATNYATKAQDWERYIDTSAYFIEVTLMAFWNKDTRYTPGS